jgi:serine/threonine protein kinase
MGRYAIRILTGQHARSHHSISTRSSWASAAAGCGSLLGLAYLSFICLDSSVAQNESKTSLLKKPENDHHNILYRKYHVEHVIGSGGFANVSAGREKLSDSPVAIKCMPKRLTSKAKFEKEVSILKQLKGSDHVVQLKEAFETRDDWVLVMDLVPGGELFDRLISKGTYTESQAKRLTLEISQALKQLHGGHVIVSTLGKFLGAIASRGAFDFDRLWSFVS